MLQDYLATLERAFRRSLTNQLLQVSRDLFVLLVVDGVCLECVKLMDVSGRAAKWQTLR